MVKYFMKTPAAVWGIASVLLLIASCAQPKKPEPPRPQPVLMVLNKSENTATILNPDNGEKLATLVTGVAPHEAAVSAHSHLAVITNYGTRENPGSSLTVVDLKEYRVLKTIDLGKYRRPHGILFLPGGSRVAVTAEGNQSLIVVDIETGTIEKTIRTRQKVSHMVALDPRGKTAYVANIGSGTISILDLEESRLVKNLRTGKGTEGLDLSPDGKELWVANRGDDTLAIVDTETLKVEEKLECAGFPIRVRFTPDGRHVLVSNARSGDIAVFSAESRKELRRIPMEFTAREKKENRIFDFDLSPVPIDILIDEAGNRAFVANSNADLVSVIDLNEWKVKGRLTAGKEPDGMAFTLVWPETPQIESSE